MRSELGRALRTPIAGLCAAVLAITMASARASAAPESSDSAKAEALIAKANELRRQGQDERALPLVREAYEISRTPRSAAQLGLAELAVGYWNDAQEHLNEALTAVSHHPWVDKNRHALATALEVAKSHLASLTIEGTPDGAQVLLNRKAVGELPLPSAVTVNEGRVEVEVRAAGYTSDTRVLTLKGAAATRVTVNLAPVDAPAPRAARPAAPTAEDQPRPAALAPRAHSEGERDAAPPSSELPTWRRALPWTFAAGALVAGAFGVWQQLRSGNALDKFEAIDGCGSGSPGRGSDPRCQGLYDDYATARTRAIVGYSVTAVLGGCAAGLLIWNAVAPAGASDSVALGAGPGDVGLSYRAAF